MQNLAYPTTMIRTYYALFAQASRQEGEARLALRESF